MSRPLFQLSYGPSCSNFVYRQKKQPALTRFTVSKKQFSITGDILSRNFGSKKENPMVDGSASTPETVSYTHLDVYKRQVISIAATISTISIFLLNIL